MANLKSKLAAATLAAIVLITPHVHRSEGTRLMPYRDPVGVWTDCVGHTGPDVVPGKKNTPAQCLRKLEADLTEAAQTVESCYPVGRMSVHEKAAMIDMGFNLGPGGKGVKDGICWLKSGSKPRMRTLFEQGQNVAACNEIPKWNLQKLPGITTRRNTARDICLTKD